MAGQIKVNQVQLGDSLTATQNFVWQTNVDGTAKLARGNVGATTQDILTVDATGKITIPTLDVTTLDVTTLTVPNKAWAAMTANGAASPTINGSSNIASITRTGTGVWLVTFTTPMPNTNYRVMTQHGQLGICMYVNNQATGSFNITAFAANTVVISDIASTIRCAFAVEG
jgi:hypothetical protein